MIQTLLKKAYFWLLGPIYRNLLREITLAHQEMVVELLRLEERLTSTIADELIRSNMTAKDYADTASSLNISSLAAAEESKLSLSDFQMGQMMQEIKSGLDLISASRKWQVPVADLLNFERQYGGMDALGVKRVRELERANIDLRKQLLNSLANKNEKGQYVASINNAANQANV